jgi:hypothetical protein
MDDAATQPRHRWRFENAELDEARAELRIDGPLLPMDAGPLQLLAEELPHAGTVLTEEELPASEDVVRLPK